MLTKVQLASLATSVLVATPGVAQPAPDAAAPAVRQEAPIIISRRLPSSPDLLMRTVFIGDLNLATAAGQKEMETRVSKAVDDMCTVPAPLPSYKGRMEKPCRDEALESARWQMNEATQRASHGS